MSGDANADDGPRAWHPGLLWDGCVAPRAGMSMRGVLWYQGEGNAWRAKQYQQLFPLLIRSWREAWGRELPFCFVQIACHGFGGGDCEKDASVYSELREAQALALKSPGTAMAVSLDTSAGDIHPRNKAPVGDRLARCALAVAYAGTANWRGPALRSASPAAGAITVELEQAAGIKTADGQEVRGFTIAAEDRVFVPAQAEIQGSTVVVRSAAVAKPVAVRYGWSDNPSVNLVNADGLPASSFRSDSWPGFGDDIIIGGAGLPLEKAEVMAP